MAESFYSSLGQFQSEEELIQGTPPRPMLRAEARSRVVDEPAGSSSALSRQYGGRRAGLGELRPLLDADVGSSCLRRTCSAAEHAHTGRACRAGQAHVSRRPGAPAAHACVVLRRRRPAAEDDVAPARGRG